MIGRYSFVQGDPARVEDAIAFIRDNTLPLVDAQPGSHGLGLWVNRETGEAVVLSVWRDLQALEASEALVAGQRQQVASLVSSSAMQVERYQPALIDAARPQQPGDISRLLRLKGDPATAAANTEWARTTVLPLLRSLAGYVSYSAALNYETGDGVVMVTYGGRTEAEAAFAATTVIRDALAERGIDLVGETEYEVAIVGIHAPVERLPGQRTAASQSETQV
jgi:hypothetical protein